MMHQPRQGNVGVLNRKRYGSIAIALVLVVIGLPVIVQATLSDKWFFENGSNVTCGAQVIGDGLNYMTLDIRIYGPSGALLGSDAVAGEWYESPLQTSLNVQKVGSGTYLCRIIWDDGTVADVEEDT